MTKGIRLTVFRGKNALPKAVAAAEAQAAKGRGKRKADPLPEIMATVNGSPDKPKGKRGRPFKQDAKRLPSGRLSREKAPEDKLSPGAPSKMTPEIIEKFGDAVAMGLTDEEAAALCDLHPDTITEWNKNPEFTGAIKREKALRLYTRLLRVQAGYPGWQGTAWALERNHGARFAPPAITLKGKVDQTHSGTIAITSDEEINALQEVRRAMLARIAAAN